MTDVKVVGGDITQEVSEALITAINSNGNWYEGVNAVILDTSGFMFHLQTLTVKPLTDGKTVFAKARGYHKGKFDNVLFVIDDLQRSLYDIVSIALSEAERLQLRRITLPTLRTGGASGIKEPRDEAVEDLAKAIFDFVARGPANVKEIIVVVYDNFNDVKRLREVLC